MNFLSLFFGNSTPKQPSVEFGRFTDTYKTPAQQQAWERSLKAFEQGHILEAYQCFFDFLKHPNQDNLSVQVHAGHGIKYEFWQGSRRVTGHANAEKFYAESRIARVEGELNIAFMRRLMEHNFHLKYSRFALTDDNHLAIVFDTFTVDGSPLKLLYALRELSIQADRQDDLLIDEFKSLQPSEALTEIPLSDAEKQVKYNWIIHEIKQVKALIEADKPSLSQSPGVYVYLLLGLAFRLDYLIHPKGYMMDALEKVFQLYFSKDHQTPAVKVQRMMAIFDQLAERPAEAHMREMYRTRNTFGINPSVGHDRIKTVIEGELPKMDWHVQQGHATSIAMAIPNYIVGYGLFHCVPPRPDAALLHLFYQVTCSPFFEQLGFERGLTNANGVPDRKRIEKAIRQIKQEQHASHSNFNPDLSKLRYESLSAWARSYLLMLSSAW
jgi:hypothetical protein